MYVLKHKYSPFEILNDLSFHPLEDTQAITIIDQSCFELKKPHPLAFSFLLPFLFTHPQKIKFTDGKSVLLR